jgi:Cu2+-exporting ATPase
MKKTMKVDGIHCGGCEARLKRTLEALPEVEKVVASHVDGSAVVTLKSQVSDQVLKQTVEAAGGFRVVSIE